MKTAPRTHFVGDRSVFTYQPDGWPTGCLTGYVNQAHGFILEHVIAFPGAPKTTLMEMLRAGMEEAWGRELAYIAAYIPADHPRHRQLTVLAKRCGFVETVGWWRIHRPKK